MLELVAELPNIGVNELNLGFWIKSNKSQVFAPCFTTGDKTGVKNSIG